jgi:hypothetical protein
MEDTTPEPEQAITQDQATATVGRHVLVALEDVINAHELVAKDEKATETARANARLIIAAASAFGRPLFAVVKMAEKPRILRPQRSMRLVR